LVACIAAYRKQGRGLNRRDWNRLEREGEGKGRWEGWGKERKERLRKGEDG
jgi:hypothetical protein